jgi:hypothetical protein
MYLVVPEWCSGLKHCISVQEVSLQSLVQIQAVSHLAVIGSPIGWCTIGPGLLVIVNKNLFLTDLPSSINILLRDLISMADKQAIFKHLRVKNVTNAWYFLELSNLFMMKNQSCLAWAKAIKN